VQYPYVIIDDSIDIQETLHKVERFPGYFCIGSATNRAQAMDIILEFRPQVVFLGLSDKNAKNDISLSIINEVYRYLDDIPHFIIIADTPDYAFDALKAGVFDYLLKPLSHAEINKCFLKLQKIKAGTPQITVADVPVAPAQYEHSIPEVDIIKSETHICIKSYGDYQFIPLNDVVYLKADNNTTDFFLSNGKKLTAYKTLKFYEKNLPGHFYRIHNSHIVNSNYISRISTGKSLCYLNGNDISVSFSKTFKDNIDAIIRRISPDYL
jgi:two-component system LytT family response regulator